MSQQLSPNEDFYPCPNKPKAKVSQSNAALCAEAQTCASTRNVTEDLTYFLCKTAHQLKSFCSLPPGIVNFAANEDRRLERIFQHRVIQFLSIRTFKGGLFFISPTISALMGRERSAFRADMSFWSSFILTSVLYPKQLSFFFPGCICWSFYKQQLYPLEAFVLQS